MENSLTVRDIAVTDLWYVEPSWSPAEARKQMIERGFDAAPIQDVRPHRYVEPDWLAAAESVEEIAEPIDASRLVTADFGLADGIARLTESTFFFVLDRAGLYGIVTRADLVSPPVSMVTLSLILAAEAGMDLLIRREFPDSSWESHLSEKRLASCQRILELRRQHNVETTLLDCLMLPDRLTLMRAHPTMLLQLGFPSHRAFDGLSERVNRLRDDLAHGSNLLTSSPNPLDAIQLFIRIREFAERIWLMVDRPTVPKHEVEVSPGRKERVRQQVEALAANFGQYVDAYDRLVPFSPYQLQVHRQTIALRREAGSAATSIDSDRFLASLRLTLEAWGLGVRASTLAEPSEFASAIRANRDRIDELDRLHIDDTELAPDVAQRLWELVASLGIVGNKAKVVAGTKALHHLLPDLVVPMDRAWTGRFFQLHDPEWQDPGSQRRIFLRAFTHFVEIARKTDPVRYADGSGWRTSRTKIIDNALIGYCRLELEREDGVSLR